MGSLKVELSTDYGQTKTSLGDYGIKSISPETTSWSDGCVVIVNTTTVFFAGGYATPYRKTFSGEDYLNVTFFLNINTKQWTRGPALTFGRSALTCSLITKPFPQIVIVDGYAYTPRAQGASQGGNKIVEILNLATNELTRGNKIAISAVPLFQTECQKVLTSSTLFLRSCRP